MNYFPSYRHFKNKIELELDLSNYATKFDINLQEVLIHDLQKKKII